MCDHHLSVGPEPSTHPDSLSEPPIQVTEDTTGESGCGSLPRPPEPREAPVGRSPTTRPQGRFLQTSPPCSLSPPGPGEPHARRGARLPGEHSAQDNLRRRKWHDPSPARRPPRSSGHLAGKRKAPALLWTWGIWSQRVTSPRAFPDILAGICTPELLQGRGWAPGSERGAGQHVACLWSGWGLTGPPGTTSGQHCWFLARSPQEGCRP